jgi:thioredoxin 1
MENITTEQLQELQSKGEVILADYYATWCGPCKALMPRLAAMASEYPNAKFVALDVDKNQDHAIEMGIRSVPTVIIYKGGEVINRTSGVNPESHYKSVLNNL